MFEVTNTQLYLKLFLGMLPKLMMIIITILVAFYLNKAIEFSMKKIKNHKINHLIRQTFRTVIWVIAILNIFTIIGVNIVPLLTSLGLTGFALGLACKDLLSNIIAGVMILLYSPFRIGDKITFSSSNGTVNSINYRFTELLNDSGQTILIPNSMLLSNIITVTINKDDKKDS